jgi:hypothetical protein
LLTNKQEELSVKPINKDIIEREREREREICEEYRRAWAAKGNK